MITSRASPEMDGQGCRKGQVQLKMTQPLGSHPGPEIQELAG